MPRAYQNRRQISFLVTSKSCLHIIKPSWCSRMTSSRTAGEILDISKFVQCIEVDWHRHAASNHHDSVGGTSSCLSALSVTSWADSVLNSRGEVSSTAWTVTDALQLFWAASTSLCFLGSWLQVSGRDSPRLAFCRSLLPFIFLLEPCNRSRFEGSQSWPLNLPPICIEHCGPHTWGVLSQALYPGNRCWTLPKLLHCRCDFAFWKCQITLRFIHFRQINKRGSYLLEGEIFQRHGIPGLEVSCIFVQFS